MKVSERIYKSKEVITFSKTSDSYGGLSNMAPGYSLFVNQTVISNSEILYQACRFPLFPQIQEELISHSNPMDAKKISRKYIQYTRQDWEKVKFDIMRWCLQVKLLQNHEKFSTLLLSTFPKPIVEYSTKDPTWGAIPIDSEILKGKNALGRLLMELRELCLKDGNELEYVKQLNIPAFLLFNNPIEKVHKNEFFIHDLDEIYEH